jgi:superfamily I DNA/RNA helicase
VVDEFQDFNKLEVSLIDLLARKSPILLAGDDDQALYAFKHASAEHIRGRHTDKAHGFESFTLPYCSRCTQVIVDAINDVISTAIGKGNLQGRIKKDYIYFTDKKKDKESESNPKLVYAQMFSSQIPWFIEKQMAEIAEEVKDKFSVLIISPTKTQTNTVVSSLMEKGLNNLTYVEKKEENSATIMDGFRLLLEDDNGNLGWRVVAKHMLTDADFATLIKATDADSKQKTHSLLKADLKKRIRAVLKTLRALKKDENVDSKQVATALELIGVDPITVAKEHLKSEVVVESRGRYPAIRNIPIKATTIQSSKGLAADYVFITHFDDLYFIKEKDKTKVSDQDICNFLVAMTRARKKVFLISSDTKKEPTFLGWIKTERIEKIVFKKPE